MKVTEEVTDKVLYDIFDDDVDRVKIRKVEGNSIYVTDVIEDFEGNYTEVDYIVRNYSTRKGRVEWFLVEDTPAYKDIGYGETII